MVYRIRISVEARALIQHQLAMVGITAGFVYPDLEHIARDIRRDYGID